LGKVTDTKVKELFQTPRPDFSDQTCLAQNMISFCDLNKILCQPRVLQRFLKTHLVNQFTALIFQEILVPQTGIFKNSLVYFFPDRSFLGKFPFPAWSYLRIPGISKQENCQYKRIRYTILLITKQMSYLYTTSLYGWKHIYLFICQEQYSNIIICHSKNFVD
jgi:hypothetical protein